MTQDKQQITFFIVLVATLLFFLAGVIFFQQRAGSSFGEISPLALTEVKKEPTSLKPEVLTWRTYSNNQYNFALEVPKDWREQDYTPSYPTGGTLVAFSPDPLPCASCTYFRSGYFSIRIYNQKTDAEAYAIFLQRMQAIGKNTEYQKATLGKKPGVAFANIVAAENNGWVYELSLDTENGTANVAESKVFQRAVSTISFTDLLFGN